MSKPEPGEPDLRTDTEKLRDWHAEIEDRTRCQGGGRVQRGLTRGPQPVAVTAWRCEGRWQCDDQLDIWQCADEVELDERRKRGDDEDDDE